MDYVYYYKTSDGVRREGRVTAPTRADAFAVLRSEGIRPIKLIACDGSKENGEPSKSGAWRKKAAYAGAAIALAAVAACAAYFARGLEEEVRDEAEGTAGATVAGARTEEAGASGGVRKTPQASITENGGRTVSSRVFEIKPGERLAKPRPRKQLSKQPENVEAHFLHESEAYLARYAQPGRETKDGAEFTEEMKSDLLDALEDVIVITPDDPSEIAELKHIVAGLKEEAAMVLGGGKSIDELLLWFGERQKMEAAYRRRIMQSDATAADKARLLGALSLPVE